jgi:hypothetical protein
MTVPRIAFRVKFRRQTINAGGCARLPQPAGRGAVIASSASSRRQQAPSWVPSQNGRAKDRPHLHQKNDRAGAAAAAASDGWTTETVDIG